MLGEPVVSRRWARTHALREVATSLPGINKIRLEFASPESKVWHIRGALHGAAGLSLGGRCHDFTS